jgi:hypothetical protein
MLGLTGDFEAKSPTGGRQFDGEYENGNIWYEAKSGGYFGDGFTDRAFDKFKSDMGRGLNVAQHHGKSYELFSQNSIHEHVKKYLDKKGIKYHENF